MFHEDENREWVLWIQDGVAFVSISGFVWMTFVWGTEARLFLGL